MSSAARITYRCDTNGRQATRARSPLRVSSVKTPPSFGCFRSAQHVDPGRAARGLSASSMVTVVVIPGDHHDLRPGLAQIKDRGPDEGGGIRRRHCGFEQVTGDQATASTLLFPAISTISASTSRCSSMRGTPLRTLADVPVARVEELHVSPSNGSAPALAGCRSAGRVAQAGKGNSTTRGTGISG